MEETSMLLSLVFVMLVGSFLAGSIPLFFSFSEDKLKKITVFGAGLLVGTALAVIIPEGVRSLIPEELPHHAHNENENLSPAERNITATVGLVVHAAADGVALGAAATTSHADVEMIVFLAIMLHKAPAAFGLVTFLLHEGIERQRIRKHLLIFSLAAPVLTCCTYFGIGQKQKETLSSLNATGIAMLFSAGTFLYVATVHVLAELTQNTHGQMHSYSKLPQSLETGKQSTPISQSLKTVELMCLVVGCLCPLLLSVGHHH
ncbi:hypothetical protein NQ314_007295 [Rhamnusium bicolor]|uniref:Zinc transporter ZIP9 n=1 Tax=Rhamnusium bicolor TaxID=1586634 RepID=A0AAV8YSQ5_9CUCU|nr:hypothetical protein NQ314_007295 [Rhamnusium bicolor]